MLRLGSSTSPEQVLRRVGLCTWPLARRHVGTCGSRADRAVYLHRQLGATKHTEAPLHSETSGCIGTHSSMHGDPWSHSQAHGSKNLDSEARGSS